jgi:group I intron endonuclease
MLNNRNIIKNFKNKSGIYQIINTINGKTYIGSSIDLARRFLEYLNSNRLTRELQRGESIIYKALLKYGYLSFEFKILEYID